VVSILMLYCYSLRFLLIGQRPDGPGLFSHTQPSGHRMIDAPIVGMGFIEHIISNYLESRWRRHPIKDDSCCFNQTRNRPDGVARLLWIALQGRLMLLLRALDNDVIGVENILLAQWTTDSPSVDNRPSHSLSYLVSIICHQESSVSIHVQTRDSVSR